MSDRPQGPGWWQASDRKWYAPEQHPNYVPPCTGASPSTPFVPASWTRATNGLAIASLVLSLLWIWGLGSLLAVILAVRARTQIRDSGGRQGGDGLAVAGLVIGIIGLAGTVLATIAVFAVGTIVAHQTAELAPCEAEHGAEPPT
jgi:hypothetical protein